MKLVPSLLAVTVALAPLTAAAAPAKPKTAAHFILSADGQQIGAFQQLVGVQGPVEATQYFNSNGAGQAHTKQFGKTKPPVITLKGGLSENKILWTWHSQVQQGQPGARKQLTLQVLSGGQTVTSWRLNDCWPSKLEIGGMKAGASKQVIETVQLTCDSIERTG